MDERPVVSAVLQTHAGIEKGLWIGTSWGGLRRHLHWSFIGALYAFPFASIAGISTPATAWLLQAMATGTVAWTIFSYKKTCYNSLSHYVNSLNLPFSFSSFFWPHPQQKEVPGTGTEPTSQQWPKPLLWHVNPLRHQGIPKSPFSLKDYSTSMSQTFYSIVTV